MHFVLIFTRFSKGIAFPGFIINLVSSVTILDGLTSPQRNASLMPKM